MHRWIQAIRNARYNVLVHIHTYTYACAMYIHVHMHDSIQYWDSFLPIIVIVKFLLLLIDNYIQYNNYVHAVWLDLREAPRAGLFLLCNPSNIDNNLI